MSAVSVRLLDASELIAAVRIVAHGMLGPLTYDRLEAWAARMHTGETHGAFEGDQLVGVARWFPTDLSVPGGAVAGGCVTAVAVLPTHRRRGHLRRLMTTQLDSLADHGVAVGLLLAAEWPIYGRYGYGPAAEACTWRLDTRTARFTTEPSGTTKLVDPDEVRPHLEELHDLVWARSPGAVTREPELWDRIAGVTRLPGQKDDPALLRAALWRDEAGEVRGAVVYRVEEHWTDGRPTGKAEVSMLVGATPEAERELWRHLCELDWVVTVTAPERGVDDPLPYFLVDGRAAVAVDRLDCIWARLLDLPAAVGARTSSVEGRCVVEVVDDLGYAAGRFALEMGPDASRATPSKEPIEVRLPVATLGAAFLGGQSLGRLHQAGLVQEEVLGSVARLDALLAAPAAPWSPTTY
ncbi:MAG: GNAT family N-acetyltransferase [Acidimicrobiales bacterium]